MRSVNNICILEFSDVSRELLKVNSCTRDKYWNISSLNLVISVTISCNTNETVK